MEEEARASGRREVERAGAEEGEASNFLANLAKERDLEVNCP